MPTETKGAEHEQRMTRYQALVAADADMEQITDFLVGHGEISPSVRKKLLEAVREHELSQAVSEATLDLELLELVACIERRTPGYRERLCLDLRKLAGEPTDSEQTRTSDEPGVCATTWPRPHPERGRG